MKIQRKFLSTEYHWAFPLVCCTVYRSFALIMYVCMYVCIYKANWWLLAVTEVNLGNMLLSYVYIALTQDILSVADSVNYRIVSAYHSIRRIHTFTSCKRVTSKLVPPNMFPAHIIKKHSGFSLQANYTDWTTAACWHSYCQLLRIDRCHVVSVTDPYDHILCFLDQRYCFFFQVAPHLNSRGWVDPSPDPCFSENVVATGIEPGPLDL
jgi:hypothetical protein